MDIPVTQRVGVGDGRVISCRSCGKSTRYSVRDYVPVIFFHGAMNSSKFMPLYGKTRSASESLSVRFFTFDRPGIGDSMGVDKSMTYSKVAKIMITVIDKVIGKGRKVALVGFSSGGPYALATATLLGERATSLSLISSDSQYFKYGHPVFKDVSKVTEEDRTEMVKKNVSDISETYRKVAHVEKQAYLFTDLEEALKQEYAGILLDLRLETTEWDFAISELNPITDIYIWHGTKDRAVPISYAKDMYHEIQKTGCKVTCHWEKDETHSLIRRKFSDILTEASESYRDKVTMISSAL